MKERVIIIKHGDCYKEYQSMYTKENIPLFDGPKPYIRSIVDFFHQHRMYELILFSFGKRNKIFKINSVYWFYVVDILASNIISRILKIIRAQVMLFLCLLKSRPVKIIYLADVKYLSAVLLYAVLLNKKIHLFLTISIEKYNILNRVIVMLQGYFAMVVSRNKTNLEILSNLGFIQNGYVFYPIYSEISKSYISPTVLRNDKNFKILFIGRLEIVKGIKVLQDLIIMTKNTDMSFYIVGEGSLFNNLYRVKMMYNITNLHLLGYIPNSKIYSYINDADIGIIPSLSEGVCKVAWEFMLMGKPVIGSKVGGITEIIEDGINGILIDRNDAIEYHNKLLELRCQHTLLANLTKGAFRTKKKILRSKIDFSHHLKRIFI